MESFLNPYDKECMRLAILKHEETFKQQVHELHRLYRIQKLLMRNIEKERPNQDLWSSKNNISFTQSKAEESRVMNLIDESEIELTLGPSNYNRRRNNSNKTNTPLTSDSGPSFSSSSSRSNHHRNGRFSTKIEESNGKNVQVGLFEVPDMNNLGNYHKEKQTPWLFQALSLNMT